jgi:hypothetical protein
VFFGHYQRPRHQAGQQLEHRIRVDTVPTADRLRGLQGATAGKHCQPGQQPLFRFGEQLVGPVDGGPECLVMRQRAAAASTEHSEAALQPLSQFGRGHRCQAGRR